MYFLGWDICPVWQSLHLVLQPQPRGYLPAHLVLLDRDALYVYASCGEVLVSQGVLRLGHTPGLFCYDTSVSVAGLMEVDVTDTRLLSIPFQVLDKSVRGERIAGIPRAVVPRPQWAFGLHPVQPTRRGQIVHQGVPHCGVCHFTGQVVTALHPTGQTDTPHAQRILLVNSLLRALTNRVDLRARPIQW
jgi:hypothetical protein